MSSADATRVRLDIWLDVACLFRTRSEAQKSCTLGRVAVNGQPAKPHRPIQPGDQVVISRPFGRRQTVIVQAVADRHIARSEARTLYEDRTPPPSEDEIAVRRLEGIYRAASRASGTPDKRQRRAIRRLKGR